MSNTTHPKCEIRSQAKEAKKRLQGNKYDPCLTVALPPKGITPSQKSVYLKLRQLLEDGEEIVNPIQQLADEEVLKTLSHDERQRYIFQLSSDYITMRSELLARLS
ncbi:MAG: hypothetical protein RR338_06040 [Clostridia bacterium]